METDLIASHDWRCFVSRLFLQIDRLRSVDAFTYHVKMY